MRNGSLTHFHESYTSRTYRPTTPTFPPGTSPGWHDKHVLLDIVWERKK